MGKRENAQEIGAGVFHNVLSEVTSITSVTHKDHTVQTGRGPRKGVSTRQRESQEVLSEVNILQNRTPTPHRHYINSLMIKYLN